MVCIVKYIGVILMLCVVPLNLSYAQNTAQSGQFYDILNYVYNTHPRILAARMRLEQTQELSPQARAGWRPSVTAEASIFTTDIDNSNFNGADGATTKDITLNVTQPLWRGGQTTSQTQRAAALINVSQSIMHAAQQDVLMDTITAYANLMRDRDVLDLYEDNEDILTQDLAGAHERFDIGAVTNTDIQQAQTKLTRAKSKRINAARDVQISIAKFEQITQMTAPVALDRPQVNFDIPTDIAAMLSLAEQQSPILAAATYEHVASQHDVDAARGELHPQVSAFAAFNQQYDPQPGVIDDSQTQTFGVRATLNLYQGGALRSRIREANKIKHRRALEINEEKLRMRQAVKTHWQSYSAAQAQSQLHTQEVESAAAAMNGVREEAQMGQRTILDISDATEDLIDAKVDLANAKRDETVLYFKLAKSLGLLGEGFNGLLHVPTMTNHDRLSR